MAISAIQSGAQPVFVDARPQDGIVDPELVAQTVDTLRVAALAGSVA